MAKKKVSKKNTKKRVSSSPKAKVSKPKPSGVKKPAKAKVKRKSKISKSTTEQEAPISSEAPVVTADGYSTDEVKPTEKEVFDEVETIGDGTNENTDDGELQHSDDTLDDEGYF